MPTDLLGSWVMTGWQTCYVAACLGLPRPLFVLELRNNLCSNIVLLKVYSLLFAGVWTSRDTNAKVSFRTLFFYILLCTDSIKFYFV